VTLGLQCSVLQWRASGAPTCESVWQVIGPLPLDGVPSHTTALKPPTEMPRKNCSVTPPKFTAQTQQGGQGPSVRHNNVRNSVAGGRVPRWWPCHSGRVPALHPEPSTLDPKLKYFESVSSPAGLTMTWPNMV